MRAPRVAAALLLAALCAWRPAIAQDQGERLRLHRFPAPPPVQAPPWTDRTAAVLRGLDKSSGRTETFEIAVGSTAFFGRLEITLNACRTPPEGDTDDAVAHLTVVDRKLGADAVFAGWMFASAPALSALDHPRYDVWAIACKTASGSSS